MYIGDARVRAGDPAGHDVRRPEAAGGYPPDRRRRVDAPPDNKKVQQYNTFHVGQRKGTTVYYKIS